jgi:KipI family sensor histidine kinase inhibitor
MTRFVYASDQSLLVYLGEEISPETHRRVARLTRALEREPLEGVLNLHPAYCSVLVRFDALRITHEQLEREVTARLHGAEGWEPEPRTVRVPVRYGGEFGPDLAEVGGLHGLTLAQVIEAHAAAEYTVYFFGFAPGFAYLGGLPPGLATPRLATPRRQVPAGSVAIGGAQAGIYPFATPGGWRIIGRTPLIIFNPARDPVCLLAIGDRVRFEPAP